ncbi:MAG TPA: PAS domain S-box protein [Ideonella sp.]|uniref:PAS domain S-box protein n=1 Tax=Ideonella sp. TaxID=1929293 RepID=UPI002E347592|nr:PAS domain S-box protein [Ideonella sp.]HEX5682932.1 PAS domain S-box protein [Ideonella sp.]
MPPVTAEEPFAGLPFAEGARQAQAERDRVAVRALLHVTSTLAGLLWLSVPLQLWLGPPSRLVIWRLLIGAVLLAGAGGAVLVARRRSPRTAAGLLLLTLQLAFGLYAWFTGLGLQSILLSGSAVLIVLAGMLTRPRVAWLLAGLHLVLLVLIHHGEFRGLLPDVPGPPPGGHTARLVSHVLLTAGALAVATILGRQYGLSLHEAWVKEHRLSEFLRLGSDWTWEADRHGRMTHISPSFERHTGRTVAEFMRIDQPGGPRIVHDDEWAALIDDLRARRAYRGRVITFECADGQLVCVRGTGEPVLGATGNHLGWWGISQNVTGEVLAAREHERSRALLDRLVRLSPDAIVVASLRDGRIMLANPGFLSAAGCERPEEVIGRSALELGMWREPAEAQALTEALVRASVVRDLRTRFWRQDGSLREASVTAARFEWDGEPVSVMMIRDITEAERSRLQGDAILNHAAVGVALVRERRVVRVNPRLEALLGQPSGSMAGGEVAGYFGGEAGYQAFIDEVRKRLAEGRPIEVEHEFTRPDGSRFLALLRSQLVDPRQPDEAGAIWVLEDITERRRAEQALAEAKAVAEAASDAKSAFLAHMSHEIRTPLNGVLGLARLMAVPGQPEARRQNHLRYLIDAAESLNGIVSNVLDLSKMEAGKLRVERIDFDLHDLVDKVHGAHVVLAEAKGLVMRQTIASGVPRRVRGDPLRLRQILSNFIANAIKFTVQGEVMLRVVVAEPGRLRFEVEDTGIGIAPEVLAGLFQPFAQADHSTTRRFGGTGLGLSIARELAQLMGGEVGASSVPREGAAFWAELPLPSADGSEDRPSTGLDGADRPLRGLRLLVAEDNPVNMLIAAEMLARLGASVSPAHDGAEAVQACQAHPEAYDAVLMDLHMPVLDGLEAVRQLRADPTTRALPVVAFSAAALDHERAQARDAGMDDFVGKPVQPDELVRVLSRWVPPQSL